MPLAQDAAPLYDAIRAHLQGDRVRLHVPGHKGGHGPARFLTAAFGSEVARLDLTELPGLDDLHAPDGPIAEAEALAAEAFGAARTFFLVNGSTAGVLAMMLATVRPGARVYVPRAMHRSLLSGLILTGASPVYLRLRLDKESGLPLPPQPGDIAEAVRVNPGGRTVVLVDPTYQGLCADLARLGAEATAAGLTLLVDEAHGAHFGFAPELPDRALSFNGVAATSQSLHKMGPALTQGSLLHLARGGLDPERVQASLALIETSSPSYVIMASLDLARRFMAVEGRGVFGILAGQMSETADRLSTLRHIRVFRPSCVGRGQDPLKLTVLVDAPGAPRELARHLATEHGLQAELADRRTALFVAGPGTTADDLERLSEAVREYSEQLPLAASEEAAGGNLGRGGPAIEAVAWNHLPAQATTPREAFFAPAEAVSLEQAIGRVAAEAIVPAPPGIPVVMPGERLDWETLEVLDGLRRTGTRCQGGGPGLAWIQVLA